MTTRVRSCIYVKDSHSNQPVVKCARLIWKFCRENNKDRFGAMTIQLPILSRSNFDKNMFEKYFNFVYTNSLLLFHFYFLSSIAYMKMAIAPLQNHTPLNVTCSLTENQKISYLVNNLFPLILAFRSTGHNICIS